MISACRLHKLSHIFTASMIYLIFGIEFFIFFICSRWNLLLPCPIAFPKFNFNRCSIAFWWRISIEMFQFNQMRLETHFLIFFCTKMFAFIFEKTCNDFCYMKKRRFTDLNVEENYSFVVFSSKCTSFNYIHFCIENPILLLISAHHPHLPHKSILAPHHQWTISN